MGHTTGLWSALRTSPSQQESLTFASNPKKGHSPREKTSTVWQAILFGSPISQMLIPFIVFIEGFCSLGAEIVALRRLTPMVGSSILVTAPTIGFFLLALALGYAAGGNVTQQHLRKVAVNFLLVGVIAGIGLARATVEFLFSHLQPSLLAYLVFIGLVLCPIAFLLGQTVPILTNLIRHTHTGKASGTALYWSTLGSFLGSVMLSVVVMQWFGVGRSVFVITALLMLGVLALKPKAWTHAVAATLVVGITWWMNPGASIAAETAYADYRVELSADAADNGLRTLHINQSHSSQTDDSTPPKVFSYVQAMSETLIRHLQFRDRDILVLGAGGFTLSEGETLNHYTYVDIDPAIKEVAERDFLKHPIQGSFIADDARHFISTTEQRYHALVVDVFSDRASIPPHLLTEEFWSATRHVLHPQGVLLANLILDSRLESAYARNVLATIESVYGRCATQVMQPGRYRANVVVTCYATSQPEPAIIYTDETNAAELDKWGLKRPR